MRLTQASHRQAKSKPTLSLVLLIFVCQIFASCVSAHNQYPQGEHNFDIMTCDFHDLNMISVTLSDLSTDDPDAAEHEHHEHSHSSCHPPADMKLITTFPKNHGISSPTFAYQIHQYAPPVRPPHHVFSA